MKDSNGNRRTNTHNAAFRRLFVGTLTETKSAHIHPPGACSPHIHPPGACSPHDRHPKAHTPHNPHPATHTLRDSHPATHMTGTHQPEPAPTGSLGLYSISLSLRSGFANVDHTVMSNPNPSFLVKRGHLLIAAHEVAGKAKAAVYATHDDGSIEHISTIADKSGAECCHIALHPNGRWVYGANRESGSLSCWPLRLDNSFGPLQTRIQHEGHGLNLCRQKSPHIYSATFVGVGTPRMPILAVPDLGTDTITLYEAPASDGIRPEPYASIYTPAGFGPRMVVPRPHHPGQLAVVGELANSVIIYDINPHEAQPESANHLESAARSAHTTEGVRPTQSRHTISADPAAQYTHATQHTHVTENTYSGEQYDFGIASIPVAKKWQELDRFDLPSCCGIRSHATHAEFSPCGRWLYVSISGKNVIAVYELDEKARVIAQTRLPCGGTCPRHFSISPCGNYLAVANLESSNIVVFFAPKAEDKDICEICRIEIPSPTCVIWG